MATDHLVPGAGHGAIETASQEIAMETNKHRKRKRNEREEDSDATTSQAPASLPRTAIVVAPDAVSSTSDLPQSIASDAGSTLYTNVSSCWKTTHPDCDNDSNNNNNSADDCYEHESDDSDNALVF